jgi:hypothetical protein
MGNTSTTQTKTITFRGRDGWVTETDTVNPVCNNKHLKIRTSKNSRGGLLTTASCYALSGDGGGFRTVTHRVFRDLYVTVGNNAGARCTEKSVEVMHAAAVSKVDDLVAQAVAHYEKLGEAA